MKWAVALINDTMFFRRCQSCIQFLCMWWWFKNYIIIYSGKPQSRFIQAPDANNFNQSRNFLQLNGSVGWGTMCYTSALNTVVATVVCRETMGMFAYSTQTGTASSYQGLRYVGVVSCQGNELSLADCTQHLLPISRCPSGDTIVTCTAGRAHDLPLYSVYMSWCLMHV